MCFTLMVACSAIAVIALSAQVGEMPINHNYPLHNPWP